MVGTISRDRFEQALPTRSPGSPLRRGEVIICEYLKVSSVWVNASSQAAHVGHSLSDPSLADRFSIFLLHKVCISKLFFIYFLFQCILNVCAFFSVQSESMKTAVMFEIFSVEIEISCTINVPWVLIFFAKGVL